MSKRQITFSDRLRYAFDNTMTSGTIALIGWLAFFSFLMILVAAIIIAVMSLSQSDANQNVDFIEGFWMSLMRTLDAGNLASDEHWGFRFVMLAVTILGIFIVSTLIGILTAGLEDKLDSLRKGRSFVVEQNHTLILGWSSKIIPIIEKLIEANANQSKHRIVILADKDKVEMEDEIRDKVADTGKTKIICRTGIPIDLDDLEIVNPHEAKSIMILTPESDKTDTYVIKSLLAIINNPNRKPEPYHIVAEVMDEANLDVVSMVGGDEVSIVLSNDLIARITVQTCRQAGLSAVYTDLLDFAGDEIYFSQQPSLTGKSFAQAQLAFEDSVLIGVRNLKGQILLNPDPNVTLAASDTLVAISEDDDTVRISNKTPEIQAELIVDEPKKEPAKESTLILGWNSKSATIVRELDQYVAPGSRLVVVAEKEELIENMNEIIPALKNQQVETIVGDTTHRPTLDGLDIKKFNYVILLCYSDDYDTQDADAKTLVTLLHLRNIAEKTGHNFNIVSEMLDLRNRALAEVTRANDFIVSDRITSLIISQLAENKDLKGVYDDLFDADGCEVYLKPASAFVKIGEQVNFYTVTESATRKGQVAIGYKLQQYNTDASKAYGVVINPDKSKKIAFSKDDKIIVLAEN